MRQSYLFHVIRPVAAWAFPFLFTTLAAHLSTAQSSNHSTWQSHAEPRIKSIYERGEFRAKSFQPNWLADRSGFLIDSVDSSTKEKATWFYDMQTGARRVATKEDKDKSSTPGRPAAAFGEFKLETRDGKLLAVNTENHSEIVLAASPADREVEIRNPQWSPDGSKVLFIEADVTEVRRRWVLVPGDPSYPEVQQNRFARVGEQLEKLRIGVVNKDGGQVLWLPIEYPEEGVYLGQVEWAGNSNEVLVERFSRFRDKRDFLLVSLDGQAKTIFTETDKAWVEASQGWNSGLVWIRGGQEFVVISEKDGWRHAYRYSREGKELALLTAGDYDIIERAVIDEDRGWYYFYASPLDGTQRYLYRVALDGSGRRFAFHRMIKSVRIGTPFRRTSPGRFIRSRH